MPPNSDLFVTKDRERPRSGTTGSGPWGAAPEWTRALTLVSLAFLVWRMDFNFFWRDDWNFLEDMRHVSWAYFIQDHFGHVKPLFKLTYYIQLRLFGTNAIFFSYMNILFLGLCNYLVYRIMRTIATDHSAWLTAVLLTIHPVMFQYVGWSFEQCISLHLLFQVLAVYHFLLWHRDGKDLRLIAVALLTVVQNYFFGNGLFIPLLFGAGVLLFADHGRKIKVAIAFLLLFAFFMVVQITFGGDRGSVDLTFSALPGMISGGIHLLGVNSARLFFIHERLAGSATPWIATLLFTALVVLALMRQDRDRRLAWFHMLWFLLAFCSVPIVRRDELAHMAIPHYYTVLAAVPFAFLVEHAVGGSPRWKLIPARIWKPLAVLGTIGILLLDQELKGIMSFRHFRNEQMMMKSLQDGSPYHGFDDPYFSTSKIYVVDPVGIYAHWRPKDLFRSPIGYTSAPMNWTSKSAVRQDP